MKVLVTGASGFIAFQLVQYLKNIGYWVRGVDIAAPEFAESPADEFIFRDLRVPDEARSVVSGIDIVYHLAAVVGGIGFVSSNNAAVAADNTRMDLNMLDAAREYRVWRFFYSSSACAYARYKQERMNGPALKEEDAWPADPEPGYGLEKLYAEELCKYYSNDYGLDVRIARLHNVMGPLCVYDGGREKAPAAICRKVAKARSGGDVVVWGDGNATRSFLYVDDCVEGIYRLMHSQHAEPLNLGSSESVTVRHLAETIVTISGKKINLIFDPEKIQGVRNRNSDNTKLREVLGWEPTVPFGEGLKLTYEWINSRVNG